MPVTRSVTIDDLTPQEMAEIFCNMFADQQAVFFNTVGAISRTWPGAGMCQQAYGIVRHLDDLGLYVVQRIADHAGLVS